jgi:hypothetical protein
MKKFIILLYIIGITISVNAQNQTLKDYVQYINNYSSTPVEYIFKLFEQSDIVVIGERDHRDTTQYQLILDILKDPRFVKEIGYVYTEVGCVNRTSEVNKLIKGKFQTNEDFMNHLYSYLRTGEVFYPLWEKYNRVLFLKGLYEINRNNRRKITLGLTDCAFSWNDISSAQEYKDFYYSSACEYRDSTMAANFAQMFEQQKPKKGKRKALIITNQPHAINATMTKKTYLRQGKWLKERYGQDNVKIVIFNWAEYRFYDGKTFPLIAGGLWDAAFEVIDCKPIGMDIKGTPFGNTPYLDPAYKNLRWEDVADGIIYYKPFYETILTAGIPNIIDSGFESEFMRRTRIYYEAIIGIAAPNLEDAKSSYDGFISVPGTYPQEPDSVKSSIRSLESVLK